MNDFRYNKHVSDFINEHIKIHERISRQVYPKYKPQKNEMIISSRDSVSTTRDVGFGYDVYCMACESHDEIGSLQDKVLEWVLEHARKHVTRCPDCKNNKYIHINRNKLDAAVFYRCDECKTTYDNLKKPKKEINIHFADDPKKPIEKIQDEQLKKISIHQASDRELSLQMEWTHGNLPIRVDKNE